MDYKVDLLGELEIQVRCRGYLRKMVIPKRAARAVVSLLIFRSSLQKGLTNEDTMSTLEHLKKKSNNTAEHDHDLNRSISHSISVMICGITSCIANRVASPTKTVWGHRNCCLSLPFVT